jgi:hypothetical protein
MDRGRLVAGQRVLIHGAAGGVGVIAVKLARWRDARVTGTASRADLDLVRGLGADEVIDNKATRLEDVVRDIDMVFDTLSVEADVSQETGRGFWLAEDGWRIGSESSCGPLETEAVVGDRSRSVELNTFDEAEADLRGRRPMKKPAGSDPPAPGLSKKPAESLETRGESRDYSGAC